MIKASKFRYKYQFSALGFWPNEARHSLDKYLTSELTVSKALSRDKSWGCRVMSYHVGECVDTAYTTQRLALIWALSTDGRAGHVLCCPRALHIPPRLGYSTWRIARLPRFSVKLATVFLGIATIYTIIPKPEHALYISTIIYPSTQF